MDVAGKSNKIDGHKLGWFCKRYKERIVDGMKLECDTSTVKTKWRVSNKVPFVARAVK